MKEKCPVRKYCSKKDGINRDCVVTEKETVCVKGTLFRLDASLYFKKVPPKHVLEGEVFNR